MHNFKYASFKVVWNKKYGISGSPKKGSSEIAGRERLDWKMFGREIGWRFWGLPAISECFCSKKHEGSPKIIIKNLSESDPGHDPTWIQLGYDYWRHLEKNLQIAHSGISKHLKPWSRLLWYLLRILFAILEPYLIIGSWNLICFEIKSLNF